MNFYCNFFFDFIYSLFSCFVFLLLLVFGNGWLAALQCRFWSVVLATLLDVALLEAPQYNRWLFEFSNMIWLLLLLAMRRYAPILSHCFFRIYRMEMKIVRWKLLGIPCLNGKYLMPPLIIVCIMHSFYSKIKLECTVLLSFLNRIHSEYSTFDVIADMRIFFPRKSSLKIKCCHPLCVYMHNI